MLILVSMVPAKLSLFGYLQSGFAAVSHCG